MKLLNLVVLSAALFVVNVSAKRICGPVLVEVLETVCTGGYNKLLSKKSVPVGNALNVPDIYSDIEDYKSLNNNGLILDGLLSGNHVNTLAQIRRPRNLLGIYEECCLRGCSIAEMTAYCS